MRTTETQGTYKLLLLVFSIAAGIWFSVALVAFVSFRTLVASSIAVSHSANRLEAALALQAAILRTQRETREYILNPNPRSLEEYQKQFQQIGSQLQHLREVAQQEPLLQSQIQALTFLAEEKQTQSNEFIERVQRVGPEEATRATLQSPLLGQANQTDTELQNLIARLQDRELLFQEQKEETLRRHLLIASGTVSAGALLGILTLGGSAWLSMTEIKRRAEAERRTRLANLELTSALNTATERSCLLDDKPSLNEHLSRYQNIVEKIKNPGGGGSSGTE